MDEKLEKLRTAQWVLERNLGWIAAAEVKVGVIVTINTAMLGSLAAAFSSLPATNRTAWACLFVVIAATASSLAIFCSAISILPRVNGPIYSLIFFGRVAEFKSSEYLQRFTDSSVDDLLKDCLEQIHRNAEIATNKYKGIRSSMAWSFLSIPPWVIAIALLMRNWNLSGN